MIAIKNIREVRNDGEFDQIWAIVRSMKSKSAFIRQVEELSPSLELFLEYQRLKKAGQWNRAAFETICVPRFLKEMHGPRAVDALNMLYQLSRKDKKIALCCFCPDEALCHRSIVAGLLQGVGADVRLDSGADYSRYFEAWRQIQ